MLVLSRKLNEKIVIDGGIVVTVVKIDRNQVRLGIEAPGHVRVFREEIAAAARSRLVGASRSAACERLRSARRAAEPPTGERGSNKGRRRGFLPRQHRARSSSVG